MRKEAAKIQTKGSEIQLTQFMQLIRHNDTVLYETKMRYRRCIRLTVMGTNVLDEFNSSDEFYSFHTMDYCCF